MSRKAKARTRKVSDLLAGLSKSQKPEEAGERVPDNERAEKQKRPKVAKARRRGPMSSAQAALLTGSGDPSASADKTAISYMDSQRLQAMKEGL